MRERPALDVTLSAVGLGALAGNADAKPLDRPEAQLAPGVEVTVGAFAIIANIFGLDVEVEAPPRDARLETGTNAFVGPRRPRAAASTPM